MREALALMVIAVAVLLSACGGGTRPTSPSFDAVQVVQEASVRMEDVGSFHFEMEHQGGGTPIALGLEMTRAVGDIARPDRLQTTIEALLGGLFLKVSFITVGPDTWMTNPLTGKWEPLPSEFTAVGLFDPATGVSAIMKGVTDVVPLGEEVVGGVPSYHIKGNIDSGDLGAITAGFAAQGQTIQAEAWIGREDFLLRQVVLSGGQVIEGEKPGIVRTLRLSRFDAPVAIERPQ